MQNQCEIKLADGAQDAPALRHVIDNATIEPETELATLDALTLIDRDFVYLANIDDEPVGCVMVTRDDNAIVHSLMVVDNWRGQAIASQILARSLEHFVQTRTPTSVWTAVDEQRKGARSRFEAIGFRATGKQVQTLSLLHQTYD